MQFHNYCRVIKKTAEFLLNDDAFSFKNFDKYLPEYAIKYTEEFFHQGRVSAIYLFSYCQKVLLW